MSNENPYSAPASAETINYKEPEFEPGDRKKTDAVIKDASQFWLAILICVLCTGCGAFIVPVWYSVRLVQWKRMAQKYPALMDPTSAPGTLAAKFQSSQWKLIVGLAFGSVMLALVLLYLVVSFVLLGVYGP